NKRSCASCHKPQKAFSDGRVTSRGFRFTHDLKRNAPGLLNSGLARRFGYGLEKSDMRAQVNFVLHAAEELNTNMDEVRAKLRTVPAYVQLFQQAFPSATVDIDSTHLIDALAYFTASLRSGDSAFDRYMKGTSNAITEAVAAGYNLFMGKGDCGTCHLAPVFGGYDVFSETDRPQVGHIVDAADRGMAGAWNDYFKVPSLRNLAATAPYFHHGQVIATTDLPTYLFRDDALDEVEQAQIMAFIQCLDDNPYEDMEEVVQLPPSDMYQRRSGGMY
ncbi:MAG: cytochrome c peroxidase, partial [Bacteroidota bacterium]